MDEADQPAWGAIVLRFPPGGADQLKAIVKEAKYTSRHFGQGYRLSVWASEPKPGETMEETLVRLVRAAGLGDLKVGDERNSRLWWAHASTLYDAGFGIGKDRYPGEPPEHYSVLLGDEATRAVVEKFVQCFTYSGETKGFLS